MSTVLIALFANMINGAMLAPNQPVPIDGLPMLYECETYQHATIHPQTFDMRVAPAYRNCVAIRQMSLPEYLDWRDAQKANF